MYARLCAHWVYGGALAGLVLVLLAPVLTAGWPAAQALAFLALPVYMLHQWEEHDDDRFRRFVNDRLAGGREVLTRPAVFWINFAGVWLLLAAALWLVARAGQGWAMLPASLLLVNGTLHVLQAVALRSYNPGLATGALLFLPLGTLTWAEAAPAAGAVEIAVSLGLVLAVHAAIVAQVRPGARA